jgi:hypothetical protein
MPISQMFALELSLAQTLSLPLSLSRVMDETGVVSRTRELKNKGGINTTNSDLLVSFSFFLSFLLSKLLLDLLR